jgi:hypothetical protein
VGGTLAVLAADSDTAITATPAELNLIDGGTARGTDAIGDGDGVLINDGGTMKMTTVQTLAAYLDDEITAMPNLVTVATIGTGVWQGTAIASGYIANDAITLAKMAGGTDGNIISYDTNGDPVAIATGNDGQVLTSAGVNNPPAFEDAGGGGITEADQWRLTSQFTGNAAPIASNLERNDSTGFGLLSTETDTTTGMSESAGIFSFPDIGYWLVTFNSQFYGYAVGVTGAIFVTTNNSTWVKVAHAATGTAYSSLNYNAGSCSHVIDVEDIANVKVRFHIEESDGSTNTRASTTQSRTFMTFIRLGAT